MQTKRVQARHDGFIPAQAPSTRRLRHVVVTMIYEIKQDICMCCLFSDLGRGFRDCFYIVRDIENWNRSWFFFWIFLKMEQRY